VFKKKDRCKKKTVAKKTVAKNTQVNASAKKTNSKKKKLHNMTLSDCKLSWWLQPGVYTGDCNILQMWLQQLMCINCKT
jgi:hypothetical protein